MSSNDDGPDAVRKDQILQDLKERLRKMREAEDAELIAVATLAQLRGAARMSQDTMARLMSREIGTKVTQTEISRLERAGRGYKDRRLQLHLSRYFRSIGYDVDSSGAIIYLPPAVNSAA